MDDGIRSCRHCLWDISEGSDGKWHLAWGGVAPSDEEGCEHEPRERVEP